MSDKKKSALDEIRKISDLADSLKVNNATQRLMEELNRSVSKIPDFSPPKIEPLHYSMPEIHMPTQEEVNDYQSASVFMEALANEALSWKSQLPENYRPAILAFLYGGIQIHVNSLSKVSFHGIRIEGTLNGSPCSLLAHQSTVQMLCYGEEQTEEKKSNPIGFIWDNNNVEV